MEELINEYSCSECGASVKEEDDFCPKCGSSFFDPVLEENNTIHQEEKEELVLPVTIPLSKSFISNRIKYLSPLVAIFLGAFAKIWYTNNITFLRYLMVAIIVLQIVVFFFYYFVNIKDSVLIFTDSRIIHENNNRVKEYLLSDINVIKITSDMTTKKQMGVGMLIIKFNNKKKLTFYKGDSYCNEIEETLKNICPPNKFIYV